MNVSFTDFVLMTEEYLKSHYSFRRNVLNSGRLEYSKKEESSYQTVTTQVENALIREVMFAFEGVKLSNIKQIVKQYINSTEVPLYDPINEYLSNLPEWDGKDRLTTFFSRLSGITEFQLDCMKIWFRSVVAHWMVGVDDMHGNETVPVLIGSQGCRKTTFCRMILSPQFREYFGDGLNFSNKFSLDMALTNNLLVNIDELAGVSSPSQQANLKYVVSRCKIQGRPIYGRFQEDKKRYASFIATTNCDRPLHDQTGSRRYICIALEKGKLIDTETPVDYEQLYSQIKHEVDTGERFWFVNKEEKTLQEQNLPFQAEDMGLNSIVSSIFQIPETTEGMEPSTLEEIVEIIKGVYPCFEYNHGMSIRVGASLRMLGFPQKYVSHKSLFYVDRR